MNKQAFLAQLQQKLAGLPEEDVAERLAFYGEMIDDRVEDGLSEEDAVGEIGSVDTIAAQIVADIPLTKLVKKRIAPKRRLSAWEIVLLILGSPIWLSLLIAVVAVVLSVYAAVWTVILSLWIVFAALAISGPLCVVAGIVIAVGVDLSTGLAVAGTGAAAAGLTIFLFFGCLAATKGLLRLTGALALGLKRRFIKKEEIQ